MNPPKTSHSLFEITLVVILPILLLCLKFFGLYLSTNRKKRGISLTNSSILLAYYTEGKKLILLKSGNLDKMSYSAIATNDASVLIYRVQLPFATNVHLLGIPKKGNAAKLAPDSELSLMEEVSLEGDYNNYFNLYAEKGQQAQSRYVLDPEAMQFTVEFCKSYSWEILDGELYFVQTADAPEFSSMVGNFIKEIRPSLETELTNEELSLTTSYGVDLRNDLKCPLCHEVMRNINDYFVCPKGEGVLLNGRKLNDLKNDVLEIVGLTTSPTIERDEALTCPACGEKMELLAYIGSKQIIDTCTHCTYRWLDASEVERIKALV